MLTCTLVWQALDESISRLASTPEAQVQFFGQILSNKDGFEPRALKFVIKNTAMAKSKENARQYCASLKAMSTAEEYTAILPTLAKELKPVWKHIVKMELAE